MPHMVFGASLVGIASPATIDRRVGLARQAREQAMTRRIPLHFQQGPVLVR